MPSLEKKPLQLLLQYDYFYFTSCSSKIKLRPAFQVQEQAQCTYLSVWLSTKLGGSSCWTPISVILCALTSDICGYASLKGFTVPLCLVSQCRWTLTLSVSATHSLHTWHSLEFRAGCSVLQTSTIDLIGSFETVNACHVNWSSESKNKKRSWRLLFILILEFD